VRTYCGPCVCRANTAPNCGNRQGRRKSDPQKVRIAVRLRSETTMTLDWEPQLTSLLSCTVTTKRRNPVPTFTFTLAKVSWQGLLFQECGR
jgi:hypothetical protein